MAAEQQNPSLHIDTDWKKQAQEEKRRLAEQAEKAKTAPPPPGGAPAGATAAPTAAPTDQRGAAPGAPSGARASARGGTGAQRELPPASFATLVQTLVTQSLFYLGDLSPRGGEPMLNLDMAKHNIDLLGVLEEKTRNNLAPEEQRLLDAALYETRMRYISVASQFIS